MYLTLSRPDITFVVHQLSQFLAKPHLPHLHAAHQVLCYLNNSLGQGLFFSAPLLVYSSKPFLMLIGVHVLILDDQSRVFCVFLGDSLVSWKSKKQSTVSRSSAEAEYRAIATTTSELVWLQQLLLDFGIQINTPMPLFFNNQAAIHTASNPTFHEHTKHIEIDCHFVRDCIATGSLKLMPA